MADNFYILIVISVAGVALIFIGFILLQARSHNKVLLQQKQLADAEVTHQKNLLEAVIKSQEAERLRIGNDLHDEVGAVLSSLRMLIEKNLENAISPGTEFKQQSKEMIDRVIRSTRQISHNLSPHINGKFGLHDALHELFDTVNIGGAISASLHFNETELHANTNSDIAMAIYRVIAELLNNTIKHAGAVSITANIHTIGSGLHIRYTDDGIGLQKKEAKHDGMGLQNIESRLTMIQAKWVIQPAGTKGFRIDIEVPLQNHSDTATSDHVSALA